jgi:hypothetical protein
VCRSFARHLRHHFCSRLTHQPVTLHAERAAPDAGLHWRLQRLSRRAEHSHNSVQVGTVCLLTCPT